MPGNFKSNGQHHATMSVPVGMFWSTDTFALGNGDFQNVRVGLYGEKVTLNFSKGNSKDGSKPKTAYLQMDYESADIVARTLTYIENIRKDCIKHNVEPPLWNFKNTLQFTDKESKSLRTLGVFQISTEISPVTQKNTVYLSYTAGPDEFKVAFGSVYLKDQCEFSDQIDLDINDSRFYAFADMFRGLVLSWGVLLQQQKCFGIIMNNLGAIRGKLGIPAKTGNDGKYTDSNYSSDAGSAGDSFDGPIGDLSDLGGGDEPF